MVKTPKFCIATFALLFVLNPISYGQWEIGAGYQYRQNNPSMGSEIQFKHYFKTNEPKINLFAQVHVGYFFNETNQNVQIDFESIERLQSYDIGLSGGLELHFFDLIRPYFGIGTGYERVWGKREHSGFESSGTTSNVANNSHYLVPYLGAKFNIWNKIIPYFAYQQPRYFNTDMYRKSNGKFAVGISLQF